MRTYRRLWNSHTISIKVQQQTLIDSEDVRKTLQQIPCLGNIPVKHLKAIPLKALEILADKKEKKKQIHVPKLNNDAKGSKI